MHKNKTIIRHDNGLGNFKKYKNNNPLQKIVLRRFFDSVAKELNCLTKCSALEFGCGEGFFLNELLKREVCFESLVGVDLREDALVYARQLNPCYQFEKINILDNYLKDNSFDLVIASEVLEHLTCPDVYMKKMVSLSRRHLFFTVPWEPWFKFMNLLRGRDVSRLGNNPEHINHWGVKGFRSYVARFAKVEKVLTTFPFIIVRAIAT
jgi:2-polyprenyl-3-methyl-5-hydroxy-6-metoxy-1,4-benzoquinol methylase